MRCANCDAPEQVARRLCRSCYDWLMRRVRSGELDIDDVDLAWPRDQRGATRLGLVTSRAGHGTRAMYHRGCRCAACSEANTEYCSKYYYTVGRDARRSKRKR